MPAVWAISPSMERTAKTVVMPTPIIPRGVLQEALICSNQERVSVDDRGSFPDIAFPPLVVFMMLQVIETGQDRVQH